MRNIDTIAVHCSATLPKKELGVTQIRKWHKERGWRDIGYHYVIRTDGSVEDGRPNQQAGAHVKGFNATSLGICLIGGVNKSNLPEINFTKEQMKSLRMLIRYLQQAYGIEDSYVKGHRDFPNVSKACPCFDVQTWLKRNSLKS